MATILNKCLGLDQMQYSLFFRKLSEVGEQSEAPPFKIQRVEPSTSKDDSDVPSDTEQPKKQSKKRPNKTPRESYTTENPQRVTFEPNMFVIIGEDKNKFDYARVDTVTPDEIFGHYVEVTYFKLNENRNLVVYMHPNTKKPWTDEIARDAILKCLGFNNHVSLEEEKSILELIQEVYAG